MPNNASMWEAGFKLDILEFQGCLQAKEFLDRVAAVEMLDLKEIPEDRQVPLVATKFRGQDTGWWKQLKQSRVI